jgi:DNA-binding transcriptional LysR family regulator
MLQSQRAFLQGDGMLVAVLAWDDLRVFLAAYRTRSHAGAARALKVAPTTVGRRLAALEGAVGTRLFARTPDGLSPTAAARALLGSAERIEAEAVEAERALAGADARATGTVRVTCGDGFANFVVCPALPAFLAAHPGLSLELRAVPQALDLTRGEADLAIRNFRPRERSLVARRLGLEPQGLYAAPAYLAARGRPRSAADLDGHDLILFDREFDRLRGQAWLRGLAPRARIAVRTGSTTSLHAACAAGAGLALISSPFVAGDARFERVLPRLPPPRLEVWSATHADLRTAARVTTTLRWLEQLVLGAGFGA